MEAAISEMSKHFIQPACRLMLVLSLGGQLFSCPIMDIFKNERLWDLKKGQYERELTLGLSYSEKEGCQLNAKYKAVVSSKFAITKIQLSISKLCTI